MKNFAEITQNIKSKEDFINFLKLLIDDLKEHPSTWTNIKLEDYLAALRSWSEDMDGYYMNNKLSAPDNVSWGIFADILVAAKMYE